MKIENLYWQHGRIGKVNLVVRVGRVYSQASPHLHGCFLKLSHFIEFWPLIYLNIPFKSLKTDQGDDIQKLNCLCLRILGNHDVDTNLRFLTGLQLVASSATTTTTTQISVWILWGIWVCTSMEGELYRGGPWMSIQKVTKFNQKVAEIFQSGPKWWTDHQNNVAVPRAMLLMWPKITPASWECSFLWPAHTLLCLLVSEQNWKQMRNKTLKWCV